MKTQLHAYFFIFIVSFYSCSEKEKQIEIEIPQIPFWKMVQGKYKVTDLNLGFEYFLSISIKTDTIKLNNNQYITNDSIFLYNFNNLFDSIPSRYVTCIASNNYNCLSFTAPHGIKDKYGKRWLIANYDNPDTPEIENTWVNGKITFYFWMNNTAYWNEDGVSYQDLFFEQKAVRIGD